MRFEREDLRKALKKTDLLDGDYRILASAHPVMPLEVIKKQGIPSMVKAIEEEFKGRVKVFGEGFFLVLEKDKEIFVFKGIASQKSWDYVLEKGFKEEYLMYIGNLYNKSNLVLTLKTLEDFMNHPTDFGDENSDFLPYKELLEYLKGLIGE